MGRAPCCEKVGLKRGKWTADEDEKLIKYIASTGVASWRSLPKMAGLLRCGKSCRLRWMNYLRADLKRGNITKEEDKIILNLHETLGNRWSVIAGHLPGRTDNEIKNHWNTHLKKRAQSFRKSDKDNKETTMPNKVPSDGSRSDRLTAKKLSNNASIRKAKNSKGDDLSTLPVQSEESNMTTNPHQFSCVATSSGERLQCSNHTFPIIRDEEISLLDFQRWTTNAESQVAPSFSGPTASRSEHGIVSSASNGPDQELLQSETLSDLCQELLSPISLVVDSMASRVMCFGGETEGGALQLNESGLVDPQVWAMVDQEEVWDWDLEEIEDKLWGEEGEMWSWIREEQPPSGSCRSKSLPHLVFRDVTIAVGSSSLNKSNNNSPGRVSLLKF